jgi:RimJ/RimL family protein N-acetyltransferase
VIFDPRPVLLCGRHVRLEPLAEAHRAPLAALAAQVGAEVFRWFINDRLAEAAPFAAWFNDALRAQAAGSEVAWVTVRQTDGRLVGSTRFLDVRRAHRALEIGHTWVAPEAQRTAINTEAKYLQLRHAFEDLGAVRVQLKTDERNEASRRAIARLGCTCEGILRAYQTREDGFVRNTAMFSLIAAEWPAARAALEQKLSRSGG